MQSAVLCACGLLALGFLFRVIVRPLQWLFVPAAVVGGLLGLSLAQIVAAVHRHGGSGSGLDTLFAWQSDVLRHFSGWPGVLIAVIFAGLLLEKPGQSARESTRTVSVQAIMVWIIILGQVAIGLAATWLFVLPRHPEVPPSFGQLIEVGFAGGHGTAGAMGEVFADELGFSAGRDLGFLFATAGLIVGVITGIIYINLAVRRGWTARKATLRPSSGMEVRRCPQPVALARVGAEVIDPFLFQGLILAAAFAAGLAVQSAVMGGGSQLLTWLGLPQAADIMKFAGKMPLFMFTLLGGLAVRRLLSVFRLDDLVDGDSLRRLIGAAMEFLIVAAIASMRIEVIATYLSSILLLLALGFTWAGVCLLLIGRRLLPPSHWFELGLINYGMSTGTTAQGMMLLRIVDPGLKSRAAEDYALAAPISAPFIGGGVITLIGMPALLTKVHPGIVAVAVLAVMALLYVIARRIGAGWR